MSASAPKAVVVTRPESIDGPLSSELRELGLQVLLWPAVQVSKVDATQLEEAVRNLRQFDWIVFASRHAIAPILDRVARMPSGLKLAAVGRATAKVLEQRHWRVDLIPDEASAAALISAFGSPESRPLQGKRVLFPASSRALPTISAGLRQLGAEVVQIEAYRTQAATLNVEDCHARIARQEIAAVTFASPSAVIELERALGSGPFGQLLAQAKTIAIGPTTARELIGRGGTPVLAESTTLRGVALTTFKTLQTRH